MEVRAEPLSGGLVLSRDASMLTEGELSEAEHIALVPGSTSIHKAPGSRNFNGTAVPGTILGLAYAPFETDPDRLVAVSTDGSYYTATEGESGEFTSLATDAGATLDAATVDDRTVLFSGGLHNRVLLSGGTSRLQGLVAVSTAPGLREVVGGGAYPPNQTGFFEYWTTEVYRVGEGSDSGEEEVESTNTGETATVNVTAVTNYVAVTRPQSIVNGANATHWRAYRSEKKTNFDDQAFPIGQIVGTFPIG